MNTDVRNSMIAWGLVLGLLGLGWLGIFPGLAFWGSMIVMVVLPLLIVKGLVQAYRKSRAG
jgi:hypothetical protein